MLNPQPRGPGALVSLSPGTRPTWLNLSGNKITPRVTETVKTSHSCFLSVYILRSFLLPSHKYKYNSYKIELGPF